MSLDRPYRDDLGNKIAVGSEMEPIGYNPNGSAPLGGNENPQRCGFFIDRVVR